MAHLLSANPEAYIRSFQSFRASTHQEKSVLKCIEAHIVPTIQHGVSKLLETHASSETPFRVLSVGSGDGENDISILHALSNIREVKSMTNRSIEPDVGLLSVYRTKVQNLPDDVKIRATIDFEWIPMTFQDYSSLTTVNDQVKFDVVHFIHSIYYAGIKDALVHCYDKELGARGIIITIAQDQDSPVAKYNDNFPGERVAAYPSNGDVIQIARERRWKYFVCPGDFKHLDITGIFDSSSREGNHLLDFLMFREDFRQNEGKDIVEKVLKFWEEQSFTNEQGRRIVELKDNAVIIFKGLDP